MIHTLSTAYHDHNIHLRTVSSVTIIHSSFVKDWSVIFSSDFKFFAHLRPNSCRLHEATRNDTGQSQHYTLITNEIKQWLYIIINLFIVRFHRLLQCLRFWYCIVRFGGFSVSVRVLQWIAFYIRNKYEFVYPSSCKHCTMLSVQSWTRSDAHHSFVIPNQAILPPPRCSSSSSSWGASTVAAVVY